MNILFVHQNFPGKFKHLAPADENANQGLHFLRAHAGNAPMMHSPHAVMHLQELLIDGLYQLHTGTEPR